MAVMVRKRWLPVLGAAVVDQTIWVMVVMAVTLVITVLVVVAAEPLETDLLPVAEVMAVTESSSSQYF